MLVSANEKTFSDMLKWPCIHVMAILTSESDVANTTLQGIPQAAEGPQECTLSKVWSAYSCTQMHMESIPKGLAHCQLMPGHVFLLIVIDFTRI